MDANHQAVADTALLVAAIRGRESARKDRLFDDPLADCLAGERGHRLLEGAVAAAGDQATIQIVVRTRFWDEALLQATKAAKQVVVVAAGMDSRAYRLRWPDTTVVFELDQPQVMAAKAAILADDQPSCRRFAVGIDLAQDWPQALVSAGFVCEAATVWLLEGLLQYLDETAVHQVFERIDNLSASGSVLLYDVVGQTLLRSASMAPLLHAMAQKGAPWLFGTDHPEGLVQQHGWSAVVTDVATVGNSYNRWFEAATPSKVDAPRGYFVKASK